MASFIFHRKNTSLTEYTFVRWIHLNHRKVDLSIGVRLPVLDIYEETLFDRINGASKEIGDILRGELSLVSITSLLILADTCI